MKAFIALPLLLLTIVFSGCKKETINQVTPNRTIFVDIPASAWVRDDAANSYYTSIEMPEIDGRVHETNGVLVYISDDGTVYEALPNVFHGSTYVYSHEVGFLYLDIQGADGSIVGAPESTITVKIVLVESEPI